MGNARTGREAEWFRKETLVSDLDSSPGSVTCCVTLGKFLNFSVATPGPHLENESHGSAPLCAATAASEPFAQGLTHAKPSVNAP